MTNVSTRYLLRAFFYAHFVPYLLAIRDAASLFKLSPLLALRRTVEVVRALAPFDRGVLTRLDQGLYARYIQRRDPDEAEHLLAPGFRIPARRCGVTVTFRSGEYWVRRDGRLVCTMLPPKKDLVEAVTSVVHSVAPDAVYPVRFTYWWAIATFAGSPSLIEQHGCRKDAESALYPYRIQGRMYNTTLIEREALIEAPVVQPSIKSGDKPSLGSAFRQNPQQVLCAGQLA